MIPCPFLKTIRGEWNETGLGDAAADVCKRVAEHA